MKLFCVYKAVVYFLLGCIAWVKNYRVFTVVEYGVLCALYFDPLFDQLNFSSFESLKLLMSFIFCLLELILLWWVKRLPKAAIRILLRLKLYGKPSVPSRISVKSKENHYSFPTARNALPQEKIFQLMPLFHPKSTLQLMRQISKGGVHPLVGFVFDDVKEEEKLLHNVSNCGKCHHWAAVSAYLLSCNKFITYSVALVSRWLTWVSAGVWFVVLGVICYYGLIQDEKIPLQAFAFTAHAFIVYYDMMIFPMEHLEENDKHAFKNGFWWRGLFFDALKFMVLALLLYMWQQYKQNWLVQYDFLVHLALCSLLSIVMHGLIFMVIGDNVDRDDAETSCSLF